MMQQPVSYSPRRRRTLAVSGDSGQLVRKHRGDVKIFLYMGLLMLLGLVVMFAIGPQRANVLNAAFDANYSDTHFFFRQILSIGLSLGAFWVMMTIVPYKWLFEHARWVYLLGLFACILLAIAAFFHWPIAQETYGATRWFDLGIISVQPSEILKFGVLIFLAVFLGKQVQLGQINSPKETLLPVALVVGLASFFIVVVQRDLGTGISLLAIVIAMLFIAGLKLRLFAIISAILVVVGVLLIVSAPHRMARVAAFLKGDQTSTDDAGTYHIEHAKIAIGSGGLLGVGIGNSVQATGYLPEAINDSVFAIMGETFGFVGLVATIALFVALLMRLLKVMDNLVDARLKLLAAGVFGWFGAHVILNIGAMIGIIPLTGITLPLLSFGGTSMVFMAAALGLVFQLSRYTSHGQINKETLNESISSRGRIGRTRYAGRRSST